MARHVLAGDIGGTKTNLAVCAVTRDGRLRTVREESFPSARYSGLEKVIAEFLRDKPERVGAAAFGVAGPVLDGKVKTTNLPWIVRAKSIGRLLGTGRVRLLNDLESMAYGALFLPANQVRWLARGKRRAANLAVIAAGTGLGQAFLFWDGERYHPVATEGGHTDFAPRNERELALLVYLEKQLGRVSYERVLSGPGLVHIFTFFADEVGRPVPTEVRERMKHEDPGAVIGETGVNGTCAAAVEAVDTFVEVYGAQAGNLALTVMGTGGVFIGGGIAVKLLPKLTNGAFLRAFVDKGRYRELMSQIPVGIMLDPKTPLLGAAHAASELLR